MRSLYLVIPFLVFSFFQKINAQILQPVEITHQVFQIDDNTWDVAFTANIDPGWYMYSQEIESDDGPLPTEFIFENVEGYELVDATYECGEGEVGFDQFFDMNLLKYSNRAVFIQRITTSDPTVSIAGYHQFMVCDDSRCLPPMPEDFEIDLTKAVPASDVNYNRDKICEQPIKTSAVHTKDDDEEEESTAIGSIDLGESQTEGGISFDSGSSGGLVDPVSWAGTLFDQGDHVYTFVFEADIEENWSIYSHKVDPEDGPMPTDVFFFEGDHFEIEVALEESGSNVFSGYDPFFETETTKLNDDARYEITIRVLDPSVEVTGFVEYMACDDSQCLPPIALDFSLNAETGEFFFDDGKIDDEAVSRLESGENRGQGTPVFFEFNYDDANTDCIGTEIVEEDTSNFWWVFIAGFIGGLIALLTPCVFPMIPLTVSFFTKSSTTKAKGIKNAIIYGISIIVIYVLLGLAITGIFGADALNLLSTNAWFNIFFAILFVVFAISFFGYFEITLPSSWVNKSDQAADKGGLIGIFFMAFTLSLVSFSCTGPIIGTLLVETAVGGGPTILGRIPVGPLIGMFAFSLALALPFALFAAFPGWLNSMPKSGGWMNSVKVSLGFVEIALALKFLSIADLTMGWKILPYEAFVILWIACALGLAFYALGLIKFPHDSPVKKITKTRWVLSTAMFALAFYFALGFRVSEQSDGFQTPNLLSGLAPPAGHSYIFPNPCPLNLNCHKDFQAGMEYARKNGKPVLLDFTGHGCVNCRRMEDQVWKDDRIYNMINDDYVLISLYVDDRQPLEEPYISSFSNRLMRNVGNKWADFQAIHFNRNAQPYYVLLDYDGNILNQPVGYLPDRVAYREFLECGLERFSEGRRLGSTE